MKRGDIYYATLTEQDGSVQTGYRPVLILQNNVGNTYAPTTIVAPLTSRHKNSYLPTHVKITRSRYNLQCDSVIMLEQLTTIDKSQILEYIDTLSHVDMHFVEQALNVSLGLKERRC